MGLPMPIHERFAVGTRWVLTTGAFEWAPGTVVTVQEAPVESDTFDDLEVSVSFPDESIKSVVLTCLG